MLTLNEVLSKHISTFKSKTVVPRKSIGLPVVWDIITDHSCRVDYRIFPNVVWEGRVLNL